MAKYLKFREYTKQNYTDAEIKDNDKLYLMPTDKMIAMGAHTFYKEAVKNITFNATNGKLTFERYDANDVIIDLPTEYIIDGENSYYDHDTKKLMLKLQNTESFLEIDLGDLAQKILDSIDDLRIDLTSGVTVVAEAVKAEKDDADNIITLHYATKAELNAHKEDQNAHMELQEKMFTELNNNVYFEKTYDLSEFVIQAEIEEPEVAIKQSLLKGEDKIPSFFLNEVPESFDQTKTLGKWYINGVLVFENGELVSGSIAELQPQLKNVSNLYLDQASFYYSLKADVDLVVEYVSNDGSDLPDVATPEQEKLYYVTFTTPRQIEGLNPNNTYVSAVFLWDEVRQEFMLVKAYTSGDTPPADGSTDTHDVALLFHFKDSNIARFSYYLTHIGVENIRFKSNLTQRLFTDQMLSVKQSIPTLATKSELQSELYVFSEDSFDGSTEENDISHLADSAEEIYSSFDVLINGVVVWSGGNPHLDNIDALGLQNDSFSPDYIGIWDESYWYGIEIYNTFGTPYLAIYDEDWFIDTYGECNITLSKPEPKYTSSEEFNQTTSEIKQDLEEITPKVKNFINDFDTNHKKIYTVDLPDSEYIEIVPLTPVSSGESSEIAFTIELDSIANMGINLKFYNEEMENIYSTALQESGTGTDLSFDVTHGDIDNIVGSSNDLSEAKYLLVNFVPASPSPYEVSNLKVSISAENLSRFTEVYIDQKGIIKGGYKNVSTSTPLNIVDWSGTEPTVAVKTVEGLISTDTPVIDLDLSSVAFVDVEGVQAEYAKIYRVAVTGDDEITFYATEEPTEDLVINIRVVR